jgi:hypothetical protein
MPAELPDVTALGERLGRRLGHRLGIGEPGLQRGLGEQLLDLAVEEAGEVEVEAGLLQFAQLKGEQRVVPTGVQRQLVVGDHIGALLQLAPAARHAHRHFLEPQPLSGQHAGVAGDDLAAFVDQHRDRPAELRDRRGDLRDLLGRVRARVAREGPQRRDRAPLDLIGGPGRSRLVGGGRSGASLVAGWCSSPRRAAALPIMV